MECNLDNSFHYCPLIHITVVPPIHTHCMHTYTQTLYTKIPHTHTNTYKYTYIFTHCIYLNTHTYRHTNCIHIDTHTHLPIWWHDWLSLQPLHFPVSPFLPIGKHGDRGAEEEQHESVHFLSPADALLLSVQNICGSPGATCWATTGSNR